MAEESTKKNILLFLWVMISENIVKANGGEIHIDSDGTVKQASSVNDNAKAPLQVGQLTEEGVYICRSIDKYGIERDWFANVDDAKDSKGMRLFLDFNAAARYAERSTAMDRKGWIVPPGRDDRYGRPDILDALFSIRDKFNNRTDGVHRFDETSKARRSWYGSSSPVISHGYDSVMAQHFTNGEKSAWNKDTTFSIRLVRSVPVNP